MAAPPVSMLPVQVSTGWFVGVAAFSVAGVDGAVTS